MGDLPSDSRANPCLRCGACCAYYRCSFYWGETDDVSPGGVPADMTEDCTPFRKAMRGTNQNNPRCVALTGDIGIAVRCVIYDRRASTCRNFLPAYENGQPNEDCDKARRAHGLPPLTPADWQVDGHRPKRPTRPRRLRRAA
ncbi:MAG TPA: YkgJ family cysteine cluster protein [Candidatus Hydrogenedentes bacterium]|nr:YkgJ family cysteine cluster protein [Candidatus Hydrogenedentota bacterium]HPG65521.1 YkgJ family cysteine cluster protein [Candidatus Hydrogenedentota bacterium]